MTFAESLGLLCVFVVFVQLFKLFFIPLYTYVIGPKLGHNVKFSKLGKWAVITGSTDGIGKAYADLLAAEGLNVVLISRSESKLNDVASQIRKTYGVQVKVIVADFVSSQDIYVNIEEQLKELEIGVLVNNVGSGYNYPEYFLEIDNWDTFSSDIIQCNILSVVTMCKIVLPAMVERRKGVVINVSSMSAKVASPLLTIYAATKAFVLKFSTDLNAEYSKYGLKIQCVTPGFVATKLAKIRKPTLLSPSANTFVKSAIATVGLRENTTGYFPHALYYMVVRSTHLICPKLEAIIAKHYLEKNRTLYLKKHPK